MMVGRTASEKKLNGVLRWQRAGSVARSAWQAAAPAAAAAREGALWLRRAELPRSGAGVGAGRRCTWASSGALKPGGLTPGRLREGR